MGVAAQTRRLLLLLGFALVVLFVANDASSSLAQNAGTPTAAAERHEFVISNFRTESGTTLPQARIVYGTYGRLNAAKDNAVLVPSFFMADFRGLERFIGPGRLLDTSKLFDRHQ